MNLPIPSPVTILGKSFSLLDMARHITSKERRYNATADAARSGARLVAGIAAAGTGSVATVDAEDLRLFATVVERPNCGWGTHEMVVEYPNPRTGEKQIMTRNVHASTVEYLSLIDTVADAAKTLPPVAPAA